MASQVDTVSTSTNTQASSQAPPQFGRPLIPYFLTTVTNCDEVKKSKRRRSKKNDDQSSFKKELLTINMNHDLTEEQKNQQRQLLLPKGNRDFTVRRFNKEGYFEYDTIDLNGIKQDLSEADIQLVTEKPSIDYTNICEVTVLDENGQIVGGSKNNSQSYYEKMKNMTTSLRKSGKNKQKKLRKKRKSRSPHKKFSNKKDHEESFEETTDEETTSGSNSDHSSDDESDDLTSKQKSVDISTLLQTGKLISPMHFLQNSVSKKNSTLNRASIGSSNQQVPKIDSPVQAMVAPLPTQSQHLTQPLPLPGNIQPPLQNVHPLPMNGQQMDPMTFFGMPNPDFGNVSNPPFFHQPMLPQHMMFLGDPNMHLMSQMPVMPNIPSPFHFTNDHQEAPQTEKEILKNLGLVQQKKNKGKFAGGSWSNSPPPSSLPNPTF